MKRFSLICLLLITLCQCAGYHAPDHVSDSQPRIFPDYAGVTFPVNIAPPNFRIDEEGQAFQVELGIASQPDASDIVMQSDDGKIIIPADDWQALLKKAAGKKIFFRISILHADGWTRYADLTANVSPHPIDRYLVYRLLYPGYELWNEMGIYQRDLATYEEKAIIRNTDIDKRCVNCHSFAAHSSQHMMLHVRGAQGGTLIANNGEVEKVNPAPAEMKNGATYPAWHPQGRYVAFSFNEVQQFFHSAGKKPIEVSDMASDLMIYDTERHLAFTDTLVCGEKYMETFPTWSPDGRYLYFCRATARTSHTPADSIRYDIYRVSFDARHERLYGLELVFEASAQGKSASFPRLSPDGRYLLFTLSDYGQFSIWHPESDLYLLTLANHQVRSLTEANSPDVDSYHTFSSDGRWIVFSSKRMDGLWARPFIASFDPATGCTGKPFVLPQADPDFYDTFSLTYNIPELITQPVECQKQLLEAVGQSVRRTSFKQ